MSHFSLVAAFALSAIVPLAAFADQHEDSKMKKCAEVCAACQVECDSCFDHCLKMLSEGKKEHQQPLECALTAPSAAKHARHCVPATVP